MPGSGTLLHVGGGSSHESPPVSSKPASDGGGGAFTLLYDLFEQRVFNVCHRLLGSTGEAAAATQETFLAVLTEPQKRHGYDSSFRLHLFAAAHDACRHLAGAGQRAQAPHPQVDEVYVDPERASMLSGLQDDVRAANHGLAATEREVLALRELEYFSYAEIAQIMRTDQDTVAEAIAGARLRLRDALRGSTLADAAHRDAPPDCRRALPLMAMAQDAQATAEQEREWLAGHLQACETCRRSREAMEEAGISYRAWLRIVPLHWLREATVARACELAEAGDALPVAEDHDEAQGAPGAVAHIAVAAEPLQRDRSDRRRFALGALSTLLLLLGVGVAMVIASAGHRHRPAPAKPAAVSNAATTASAPAPIPSPVAAEPRRRARRAVPTGTTPTRSSGTLGTRVATTSPAKRSSPKRVQPTPVRGQAEGGGFVPTPSRPAPPARPTPSAPTTALPARPSGGTPGPSNPACGSPSGAPGAC